MKLKKLARSLALIGLGTQLAGIALAQGDAPKLERVEITGSSIKRIASEGALPVQTISKQEMERAGIVTAEQLISSLSINGNGLDNLASNADVVAGAARGNNGASSANLRGQGAASTLVLVNGRRVAAHGLNGGIVDLNSIPMAAVEKVEILKDGASSLYGTDAIGGVINFILRKNYRGLEGQVFTDVTQHGGGNITRFKAVGGFGDLDADHYNVMLSLGRSENKALRGDQRDFVNTFQPDRGLSVDTRGTPYATLFPLASMWTALSNKSSTGPTLPGGTLAYSGINTLNLPGGAGCSSIDGQAPYDAVLWASPGAKYGCAWDTGRAALIQQPITNTNLLGRATFQAGEHQLFAEWTATKSDSNKSFSANQISSSATASSPFFNLAYPSTGASYNEVFNTLVATFPSVEANRGQPLAFRWRCMPCGNREIDTDSKTQRLLLGAEGPISSTWDYKTGLSYATAESSSVLASGFFYSKPFAALINSGVLNPFLGAGQSQTAEATNALAGVMANGVTLYGGKTTMVEFDATVTGPVYKLPAGDVMVALGTDLRTEKYKFNGNSTDVAIQNSIFNAPFDSINTLGGVKRDVKAVFTEVLVPITKGLDFTLSGRHDSYTGFGTTNNPKVSLRFSPTDTLVTRASYSTGFRVPNFNQLFNGITISPYSGKDLVDPTKCPSLKVDATKPGCEIVTPDIFTGGRPELGPEKSKQASVGFVWAPSSDYSIGADAWTIYRTGTIQLPSQTDLINNYNMFTGNFLRDASGNLVGIDERWTNAGGTITTGVDINGSAAGRAFGGRWSVLLDGSYLVKKVSRLLPDAPWGPSEINQFTRAGDLGLRWKHSLTFSYQQNNWTGTLIQLYRSGYKDAQLPGVANGSIIPVNWSPNVKSYMLFNASVAYTGIKNLGLTVGIKNLFDKDPPFSAAYDGNTGAGSSWEPRVADPRGRSYTFTVDYKFL